MTVQGSLHSAVVRLGAAFYTAESMTSDEEAMKNATTEALTKTYHAFSKIPNFLQKFSHNSTSQILGAVFGEATTLTAGLRFTFHSILVFQKW